MLRGKKAPLNSWWPAVPGDLGWTRGVINHTPRLPGHVGPEKGREDGGWKEPGSHSSLPEGMPHGVGFHN